MAQLRSLNSLMLHVLQSEAGPLGAMPPLFVCPVQGLLARSGTASQAEQSKS